ncbi:MAG: NfeD family protein [Caldisericia bacterium]|nr:NfeD family protein [Caldisericia bacterium]MDD4614059.1 NfeD family protein [Caldisericia bacterium]
MPFPYYWIVLGVVLIVLEIFTPGFFLFLTGIAALVTGGLSYLFPNVLWLQWVSFIVLTVLSLVFLRGILLNKAQPTEPMTSNADGLIGNRAIVIRTIEPDSLKGQVRIGGEVWLAQSEDQSVIPEHEEVIVHGVRGTKLIVGRS